MERNRAWPFPRCPLPLRQHESSSETVYMKMPFICKLIFMQIKLIFIKKKIASGLVLKQRRKTTRKWPIRACFGFVSLRQVIGLRKLVHQSEIRSKTEYGKLRSVPGTRGILHVDPNQIGQCWKHFFMNNNELPAYTSDNTTFIWRQVN